MPLVPREKWNTEYCSKELWGYVLKSQWGKTQIMSVNKLTQFRVLYMKYYDAATGISEV